MKSAVPVGRGSGSRQHWYRTAQRNGALADLYRGAVLFLAAICVILVIAFIVLLPRCH